MKKLLILAMVLFVPLSARAQPGMPPLPEKSPTTLAFFYADWCPNCKMLEPKLNAAISALPAKDREKLKIITFDFSNDLTVAESAALAGQNGLSDLYNHYSPKTGFVILVDETQSPDHQIMIKPDDSQDVIKTKLAGYIAGQSSRLPNSDDHSDKGR